MKKLGVVLLVFVLLLCGCGADGSIPADSSVEAEMSSSQSTESTVPQMKDYESKTFGIRFSYDSRRVVDEDLFDPRLALLFDGNTSVRFSTIQNVRSLDSYGETEVLTWFTEKNSYTIEDSLQIMTSTVDEQFPLVTGYTEGGYYYMSTGCRKTIANQVKDDKSEKTGITIWYWLELSENEILVVKYNEVSENETTADRTEELTELIDSIRYVQESTELIDPYSDLPGFERQFGEYAA